jgi:hypothetical protein
MTNANALTFAEALTTCIPLFASFCAGAVADADEPLLSGHDDAASQRDGRLQRQVHILLRHGLEIFQFSDFFYFFFFLLTGCLA